MECDKWNCVLVEWVNCLKLCKTIQSISELQSGEFFANLQKVINKSSENHVDILTFLFDLFAKHYPHFQFDNKYEIHLNDLPLVDLKSITTLLMHYTCIYDRRDVLTSPLCHSLSQTTQIIIRNFLQKVTKDLTNDTINGIIENCIDDACAEPSNKWLIVESSSVEHSPLQDFLKTPVSKFGRLQQKDREIAGLKADLEAERFEKADLQDEIKRQIEKNKKISEQLTQKTSEITRLRGEIAALENRTPPQYQDADSRDLQRRLRLEIQNLEQYIQQLEEEQEELKNDNDKNKENMRKIEAQVSIWQAKFFEIEQNYENLIKHSSTQDERLKNLQIHCDELTTLLDEYRGKHSMNESSIEENFTLYKNRRSLNLNETVNYENLACSVVEVQLRDAVKRNEDLEQQLFDLRSLSEKLSYDLKQVEDNLEDSKVHTKALEDENISLLTRLKSADKQIVQLNQINQDLSTQNESIQNQLSLTINDLDISYKHLQEITQTNIETEMFSEKLKLQLNHLLCENKNKLNEFEDYKTDIRQRINEYERIISDLKNSITDQLKKSDNLEQDKKLLISEVDNLRKTIAESVKQQNENITMIRKLFSEYNFEIVDQNENVNFFLFISDNVDKLLNIIKEKDINSYQLDEKIISLHKELELNQMEIQNMKETETALQNQLLDWRSISEKLTTELSQNQSNLQSLEAHSQSLIENNLSIKTKLEYSENQNAKLGKQYEEIFSYNQILQSQVAEKNADLDFIKNQLKEITEAKVKVEMISDNLKFKLTENGNKVQKLEEEVASLQKIIEYHQKQKEILQEKLDETEKLLSQYRLHSEKLSVELEESQLVLQTKEAQCKKIEDDNSSLLSKLQLLDVNLSELSKQNDETLAQNQKLQTELSQQCSYVETVENQLKEITDAKLEAEAISHKLEIQLVENGRIIEELNQEIVSFQKEIQSQCNQQQILEEKSQNLERQLSESVLFSEKLTLELKQAQLVLESNEAHSKTLEENNCLLESQLEYSKEENSKLNKEKEEFLAQIQTMQYQLIEKNTNLETIEKQLREVSHAKSEVESISNKLKYELSVNINKIEELNKEIMFLKKNCETHDEQHEIVQEKLEITEKQLIESNLCSEKLVNELKQSQSALDESETHSKILEASNVTLLAKLASSEEKLAEIKKQNEEILSENQRIEHELSQTIINLKIANDELRKMKQAKIEVETNLEQLQHKFNQNCEKMQKLHEERILLQTSIEAKEKQYQIIEDKYEDNEKQLIQSHLRSEELAIKLKEAKNKLEVHDTHLKTLEANNASLLKQLKNSDEQFVKLNEQNKEILTQNLTTQKQLSRAMSELENLQKQLEEEIQAKLSAETLSDTLKCELSHLQKADEKKLVELENYKFGIEEKLKLSEGKIEDYEMIIAELKNVIDHHSEILQNVEDDKKLLNNLKETIKQYEMKNAENLSLLIKLFKEHNIDFDNEEKNNDLNSFLSVNLEKIVDVLQAKALTEMKQQSIQETQIHLEKQILEYRTRCEKLDSELRQTQVYLQELQEQLRNSDEQLNKVTAEKDEINSRLQQENIDLATTQKQLEATTKAKIEAETVIEKITNELNQVQTDINKNANNVEQLKLLQENIEDYEITISGLKNVIDNHLENLQNLEDDKKLLINEIEKLQEKITETEIKEKEGISLLLKLLKDYNIECVEETKIVDVNSFLFNNLEKVLISKRQEELQKNNMNNEIQNLKMKNSSMQEMINKLQMLVMDTSEICTMDSLKSNYEIIHEKINQTLCRNQELEEQLAFVKKENDNLIKSKIELESRLKSYQSKKIEKENILTVSSKPNIARSREEELKKENMLLKRKFVLTENAKNNLEKVLKELREEKKKIQDEDVHYKKLLQEYIEIKAEHERAVKEKDEKYENLQHEFEQFKIDTSITKGEDKKKLNQDLENIREAYGNVMSANSKLELENVTLRKIIQDRNSEVADLAHIKEMYEKLLEENNKLLTEVDTVKYKRNRDKEEFVRLLKKERENSQTHEGKKIQEIRMEYEGKLEKMKEKMVQLYREEINKREQTMLDGQHETISGLKSKLFEAQQKIQLLEMEKEIMKTNKKFDDERITVSRDSCLPTQTISTITTRVMSNREVESRRASTLPRGAGFMEEVTISRRTSIGPVPNIIASQNLQMEDEEDMFNDKYLTDLKEGKCVAPSGRESNVSRFSELAWRNSLMPPHLKSSYPAETQFVNPNRFKDDDIKSGTLEFDDSLCKLLPGEKQRKKDFGTTSYKKPGPPTPSKNGGRLSLQGNEVHPMRDHCEAKTPKKSTPSRIRALFTSRLSSSSTAENTTPTVNKGNKRLNIFRKPR